MTAALVHFTGRFDLTSLLLLAVGWTLGRMKR